MMVADEMVKQLQVNGARELHPLLGTRGEMILLFRVSIHLSLRYVCVHTQLGTRNGRIKEKRPGEETKDKLREN
jgi:hypothetical protein